MTYIRYIITLLWVVIAISGVLAQDEEAEEGPVIPYFQSQAFNVPVLEGWENQSTDDIAQFYHAEAQATIRTNVVNEADTVVGIQQALEAFLNTELGDPIYSEKVNLADGTWAVVVYQVDDDTTASAMSRQQDGRSFVVSFTENNPDVDIMMLTIERNDDSPEDDPTQEIIASLATVTDETYDPNDTAETVTLPSGEWQLQNYFDATAMGFVFGNDSYVALALGESEYDLLPELANAYNSTLLGFFITPDNSAYLLLGLAVSIGTLAILAFSIIWRSRNLQKDLDVIQQLADDE